jgi:methylase of polypeptide subunit release factors
MIVAINHIYVDGRCAMKPKPATLGAKYVEQFRDAAIAAVHRKRPPYPEATFTVHRELLPTHNRTVLDLGTGSGEIAIPMAGYAHIVHVVEPSDALRKIAAGIAGAHLRDTRAQAPQQEQTLEWFNVTAEEFDYPLPYGLIT